MMGISSLQGSHQLAQKLIKTTLPLLVFSEKAWPSKRVPSILGATCPTSTPAITVLHKQAVSRIERRKRYLSILISIS